MLRIILLLFVLLFYAVLSVGKQSVTTRKHPEYWMKEKERLSNVLSVFRTIDHLHVNEWLIL